MSVALICISLLASLCIVLGIGVSVNRIKKAGHGLSKRPQGHLTQIYSCPCQYH
ncbi:MAG: hypothetical protein ACI9BO_000294 [Zhongshania sp.]|jgi:hypothetical protein